MRKLFTCICCFIFLSINAQTNTEYPVLIAKANLSHLQKKYKDAIMYYDQAFKIQSPDALTAYKAAGVYSLGNNADKSFHYLQNALDEGWTEADWLISDPYFDYIRNSYSEKWSAIVKKAHEKELQYSKTLQLASLRKEINLMTIRDQQLRFRRAQIQNDSLLAIVNNEINISDLDNLNRAKKIIQQYGWPKISQIGKDGQNNLWLIVQHADQDIEFQQKALSAMEKLKGTNELNMENYAFLYDRVQCNLNDKQLYGTQVLWRHNGEASGFKPMIEEYLVDQRRKKIGMESLGLYSLLYGFSYKNITSEESKEKDVTYKKQVQDLINKAKMSYKNNEFSKTYDYYNTASTFLGGMTSEENFEAAVIFSKIGAKDQDGKYKSIALDFLELLNSRKFLTKIKLAEEPAFHILHQDQRWHKINKSL